MLIALKGFKKSLLLRQLSTHYYLPPGLEETTSKPLSACISGLPINFLITTLDSHKTAITEKRASKVWNTNCPIFGENDLSPSC